MQFGAVEMVEVRVGYANTEKFLHQMRFSRITSIRNFRITIWIFGFTRTDAGIVPFFRGAEALLRTFAGPRRVGSIHIPLRLDPGARSRDDGHLRWGRLEMGQHDIRRVCAHQMRFVFVDAIIVDG